MLLTSSGGPVPAPNPPPIPPAPSPSNTTNVPTSPPSNPPNPPPPGLVPSPGPLPKPKHTLRLILAIVFGISGGIVVLALCWLFIRITIHTIRFFLVHASGADDKIGKNFTALLYKEMQSTWRYKFNLISAFFDRKSIPKTYAIPQAIQRELDRTQVGVVIITKEFFEGKWPMTELLYLVASMRRNPNGVRILPLFYRLSADEVRDRLRNRVWDEVWEQMSTDRHPIDVEECRNAVDTLCMQHGIEYGFSDRSHDLDYIKEILKEVVTISDDLRRQFRRQGSSWCCLHSQTL